MGNRLPNSCACSASAELVHDRSFVYALVASHQHLYGAPQGDTQLVDYVYFGPRPVVRFVIRETAQQHLISAPTQLDGETCRLL